MNPSNVHSWIKKYLYRSVCISFGILLLFSSVSYAEKCPNPEPFDSQIYRAFNSLLKNTYKRIDYELGLSMGSLAVPMNLEVNISLHLTHRVESSQSLPCRVMPIMFRSSDFHRSTKRRGAPANTSLFTCNVTGPQALRRFDIRLASRITGL